MMTSMAGEQLLAKRCSVVSAGTLWCVMKKLFILSPVHSFICQSSQQNQNVDNSHPAINIECQSRNLPKAILDTCGCCSSMSLVAFD